MKKVFINIFAAIAMCILLSSFTGNTMTYTDLHQSQQENQKNQEKEIIGKWKDRWGTYILYKQNDTYYLQNKYTDGSGNTQRIQVRTVNGQNRYNVAGDNSEFAMIRNGNMYWYDSDGNLGMVWQETN